MEDCRPPIKLPTDPRVSRRGPTLMVLAILLCLVEATRMWLPAPLRSPWLTPHATELYPQLTEGFMAGHLYLPQPPDPGLVGLSDPYEPARNAAVRLDNASYYKGRYYIYYGVAPILTLFLPVRLITGQYLTQRAAVTIYCAAGSLALASLLWLVRERWFPTCPPFVMLCAIAAALLADGYQNILGSSSIANHVAIAGGYAFGMLGLVAGTRSVLSQKPGRWLGFAGLLLGLAVACRPNYAVGTLCLICFLHAVRPTRPSPDSQSRLWALIAWTFLPLGGTAAALVVYNYLRFANPLEFGQRYMLGGWRQTQLPILGIGSLVENIRHYLWRPDRFSSIFPFVTTPDELATGIIYNAPWLWLAPLAAWGWRRHRQSPALRALGSAALVLSAANFLTLLFLPSGDPSGHLTTANARYVVDFQPALVLATCLGVIAAGDRLGSERAGRRSVVLAAGAMASLSILAAVSLEFGNLPTEANSRLARILNQPALLIGRWRGEAYGPIVCLAAFPRNHSGEVDPLVEAGAAGERSLIYVEYLSGDRLRFGFSREGRGGPIGKPIKIDESKPHRLELWAGSLLPPAGSATYSAMDPVVAAVLRRRVRVLCDGKTALDDVDDCPPARAADVHLGACRPGMGPCSPRFQGMLKEIARMELDSEPVAETSATYGECRLHLLLPKDFPSGGEPLITTGIEGAGDVIYLKPVNPGKFQIGWDHWGHAALLSAPFTLDAASPHVLRVDLGALHARADSDNSAGTAPTSRSDHRGVRVDLDGQVVLMSPNPTFPALPSDVAIGRNPIGSSVCAYAFTGRILGVERLPDPPSRAPIHD